MPLDEFMHFNPDEVTVGQLRQQYGNEFAERYAPSTNLTTVLAAAHVQTLAQYLQKTGE